MKISKTLVLTIMLGLCVGLATNASAAITFANPNANPVFVAVGGTVIGETQTINAGLTPALAATDVIFIQLPTGVSFSSAPVAASTNVGGGVFFRDSLGAPQIQLAGTLADTNADGLNDRATWTVHATQTTADVVTITGMSIAVASTFTLPTAGFDDINPTIAAGTTFGTANVIARAVAALAAPAQNVAAANLSSNQNGQDASASIVVFTVPAGTAVGETVTLNLPATAEFASAGTAAVLNDTETATVNVTLTATPGPEMVLTVATAAFVANSQVRLTFGTIDTNGAPVGDLNATIAGTAGLAGSVKVASISLPGTVNAAAAAILPNITRGAQQPAAVSDITLTEIFDQDIQVGSFTITAPTGVTFNDLGAAAGTDGLAAATALAGNVITVTVNVQGAAGAPVSVLTISSLEVTTTDAYAGADIPLTITDVDAGVSNGTVVVANVVAPSVTVASPVAIPTVGTGNAVTMGTGTITEASPGSIQLGTSIVLTAPTGVTFISTAPPTIAGNVSGLFALSDTLPAAGFQASIAPDGTAFWTVLAESNATETALTLNMDVNIASTVAAATNIVFTFSGNSGVTGTVTLATTATTGIVVQSGTVANPTAGDPNSQALGSIAVTENFAGSSATGRIRVIAPAGVAFPAGATGITVTGQLSAPAVTSVINPNDTLTLTWTNTGAVDTGTVTLQGLVAAGVAGDVSFQVVDGLADGTLKTNLPGATLVLAFVGAPVALTATPATLAVAVGGTADITVAGGLGNISVTSSDAAVATVTTVGRTITVTGVAAGPAVITITDSAPTPATATVNVTVATVTQLGATPGILPGVAVPAGDLVQLNLSTDTAGATAVNTWFIVTARIAGTQLPIFFVTTTGLVQLTAGMDLNAVTFAFTGTSLALPALSMANLGLAAGDQLIYGFAFMDAQGAIGIPNIVTINVQ